MWFKTWRNNVLMKYEVCRTRCCSGPPKTSEAPNWFMNTDLLMSENLGMKNKWDTTSERTRMKANRKWRKEISSTEKKLSGGCERSQHVYVSPESWTHAAGSVCVSGCYKPDWDSVLGRWTAGGRETMTLCLFVFPPVDLRKNKNALLNINCYYRHKL